MRKISILMFLLGVCLMGFSQENLNKLDELGKKQGLWKKYQDNGKLLYEGTFLNNKPVGEFKRYHTNGTLKAYLKYDVYSDSADAQLFDTRDKLMASGKYIQQQKTGSWKYFNAGTLIAEENFLNGQKDGICKTYYSDGKLFEQSEWENGLQNGIYRACFKNGKPYMECRMKDGKRDGFCLIYYLSGEVELEAFYKANLRHNQWRYFHEDGSLAYTLEYDLGILMTPEVLDSVQQIKFDEMDTKRINIIDPEQFMDDPMEYMIKNKMLRR